MSTLGYRLRDLRHASRPAALLDGLRAIARARLARSEAARLEATALAARRFAFAERPDLIARHCADAYADGEPWRAHRVGWARYGPDFGDILRDQDLRSTLILKAPSDGERGVLYLSFEYNLMRLVASGRLREIQRRYWLVCSTSWSPMDYAVPGNLASPDGPLFLCISHDADIANFTACGAAVRTVPLLASDWLRPDGYLPVPRTQRDLDIVMVANWTIFKRHWLLFEALAQLPEQLRVVLIGRPGDGRTDDTIRNEARRIGARQALELKTDIPHAEVRALLARAKVSPLLSFREGSCVAVVEAMMADTPVVMMRDGHVGSSRYVNAATGSFATRRTLAATLMRYIEGDPAVAPREWILARATASRSSAQLNAVIRDEALRRGERWTTDLSPLCWDGSPRHLLTDDEARLAPAYAEFEARFALRILRWRTSSQ
jgi:glycosyltransferase involved in cell wall biosynthesis